MGLSGHRSTSWHEDTRPIAAIQCNHVAGGHGHHVIKERHEAGLMRRELAR